MKRIGTLLMFGGAAVWVLAFCAWISGVWITLPPAAAKLYLLTLMGLSGGGLILAGAAVSRSYRRIANRDAGAGPSVRNSSHRVT